LWPTIERIATLARFDLDEFAYDVESLDLGESSKAFALRFDAKARSPLSACANPDVSDQRFHGRLVYVLV
jgi:hypothetical protein